MTELSPFHSDARVLFINNSNLSTLRLDNSFVNRVTFGNKTLLSAPNLISLTIMDDIIFSHHQLSTTCNLSFIDVVSIETFLPLDHSVIVRWLQVLSNVKTLTLSSYTLNILLMVSYFNKTNKMYAWFCQYTILRCTISIKYCFTIHSKLCRFYQIMLQWKFNLHALLDWSYWK